ncbi:hypothetical protein PCE1_001323 [Barthelona sp. PCE]
MSEQEVIVRMESEEEQPNVTETTPVQPEDTVLPKEYILPINTANGGVPEFDALKTINEMLRYIFKQYPDVSIAGERPSPGAEPVYLTMTELKNRALLLGKRLQDEGAEIGSRMLVFSGNSVSYLIIYMMCCLYGYIMVPVYTSIFKPFVAEILAEVQPFAVFVEKDSPLFEEAPDILDEFKAFRHYYIKTVLSPTESEIMDFSPEAFENFTLNVEDLTELPVNAVILEMFSSGTTGTPKIIPVGQDALYHAAVIGAVHMHPDGLRHTELGRPTALSYLPLAHVIGMQCLNLILLMGGRVMFWSGDLNGLSDDLMSAEPTLLEGVPRVMERFEEKIRTGVRDLNCIGRMIFGFIYGRLHRRLLEGEDPLDLGVGSIRAKFGGQLRVMMIGGAALNCDCANFLRCVLGTKVSMGYGLSETCAGIYASPLADQTTTDIGIGGYMVESKIVESLETQHTFDEENGIIRGEICIRGPSVVGETGPDGWLLTGDIAEYNLNDESHFVQIVGRKKHIFKLAQGEYCPSTKIEELFDAFTEQRMIYGDSTVRYPVVLIVPNDNTPEDDTELLTKVHAKGRELRYPSFWLPRRVIRVKAFTIAEGLVTPTLKLRRHQIAREYFGDIQKAMVKLQNDEFQI